MIKKREVHFVDAQTYNRMFGIHENPNKEIIGHFIHDVVGKQMDCDVKSMFKKVIFNDPATIVFWSDGTKTVVKRASNEPWDPEKGLAMAIVKKAFGNSDAYYKTFKDIMNAAVALRNVKIEEVKPLANKPYRDVILERYPWQYSNIAMHGNVFGCPGSYVDGAARSSACPHDHNCAECFSAPCSSEEEARVHDMGHGRMVSMAKAVLSKYPEAKRESSNLPRGCPDNYIDGVVMTPAVCGRLNCEECWGRPLPNDKDGRDIHPRDARIEDAKPVAQKSYREAILERYPWRKANYTGYGGVINCPAAYIDGADRITLGHCPHNRDCESCFSAPCSSSEEARIHDLRQAPQVSMREAVLSKLPREKMEAVDYPRGCPDNYIDGVHMPCVNMHCSECWSTPFPRDKDGRDIHPFKPF